VRIVATPSRLVRRLADTTKTAFERTILLTRNRSDNRPRPRILFRVLVRLSGYQGRSPWLVRPRV